MNSTQAFPIKCSTESRQGEIPGKPKKMLKSSAGESEVARRNYQHAVVVRRKKKTSFMENG